MVIGVAEIQVIANTAGVGPGIVKGIQDGTAPAARLVTRFTDDAKREFEALGTTASKAFDQLGDGDPFKELDDGIQQTADLIETELAGAATDAATKVDRAFDGIGEGLAGQLDQEATRAAAAVVSAFTGVGSQIDSELAADVDFVDQFEAEAAQAVTGITRRFDQLDSQLDSAITFDFADRAETEAAQAVAGINRRFDQLDLDLDSTISTGNLESELRSAVNLAEELDRNRSLKLDIDDSDATRTDRLLNSLDIKPQKLDIDTSEAEAKLDGLADQVDFSDIGGSLASALSDSLKAAGPVGAAAAAAGAAIGGILVKAFNDSIEREAGTDRLAAQLGLTGPAAKEAADAAEALFRDAYGGTFTEVADTVRDATALAIPDLERMVGVAFSMQGAFDGVAGEYLQLAEQFRQEGLTDSVEESLDFLTVAFQRLPGNLQEPFAEAVREYGVFLTNLGFSTEEVFGGLTDAALKGEFQLDKFGDAIKEFGIRATDGSVATVDAFAAIGKSAGEMEELTAALLRGGPAAKAAFDEIVVGVLDIEDAQLRANTAIALFGTPLEDLSVQQIPQFLEGLQDLGRGFEDVEGAAAQLDQTINDNLSTVLLGIRRQFSEDLIDLGDGLVAAIQDGDNAQLEAAAEQLGTRIGESVVQGLVAAQPGIDAFWAELVPALADGLLPEWEALGIKWGDGIADGLIAAGVPVVGLTNAINDAFDDTPEKIKLTADEIARIGDGANLVDFTELNKGLGEIKASGGRSFGPIAEEIDAMGAAAQQAEDDLERLEQLLTGLFDFSGETALIGAREIIDGLGEAFAGIGADALDATGNINLATESGQQLFTELAGVSGVVDDLFQSDLEAPQIAAALDALRGSLRAALEDAGLTDQQIDTLIATFVDADGRTAELGLLLDADAFDTQLAEALAAGQGADGLVFEPGLDVASEAFYVGLQQAGADGAAFAGNPFVTTFDANKEPFEQKVAASTSEGNNFGGMNFKPSLAADPTPFNNQLSKSRADGNGFETEDYKATLSADNARALRTISDTTAAANRSTGRITVDVFDLASRKIAAIARNRTSTITLITRGGQQLGFDGGIVDSSGAASQFAGARFMQTGGVINARGAVDGIVPPTPGGAVGIFSGVPVVVAENQGGSELFLNSKSSLSRQLGLIEDFAGGQLDRDLRRHYQTELFESDPVGVITNPSGSPTTEAASGGNGDDSSQLAGAVAAGVRDALGPALFDLAEAYAAGQIVVLPGQRDPFDDLALTDQLVR